MTDPVIKTVEVPCSQERAFGIFTSDFSRWWPKDKHSVSAMSGEPAKQVKMEARKGGVLTEIGHDGTKHNWGSVAAFEPHDRLSLMWHIGKPVEEATIVDVLFEAVPGGTKVTLTHHGWEALGSDADKMRDGYNAGWVHVFETCFAGACQASAA